MGLTPSGNSIDLIKAGEVVRHEFDATQKEIRAETASTAVAAREQAMTNARYAMALRNPRDTERFRVSILKECRRPGFATLAEYHRPVGREYDEESGEWREKIATGPSVHLIRTAIALYQNMLVDSATMFDSQEMRIVHAYVLDLENNVSWGRTVALSKQVEKRAVKDKITKKMGPPYDRQVISERVNTKGDTVYTVLATEDEMRTKEARLLAIAQRENGRSVLPRDIVDEALRISRETLEKADKEDPDAAMRRMIDSFAEMNVGPDQLKEYIGHDLARMTPAELKQLRGVFVSIREGDSTWDEVMEAKNPQGSKEAAEDVAKQKLAALSKKKEVAPSTQQSTPTAEAAKSEKTPETVIPEHQKALMEYSQRISKDALMKILGAHACETPDQVTAAIFKDMLPDLELALKDAREREQAPPAAASIADAPKTSRLKFGQKPKGEYPD